MLRVIFRRIEGIERDSNDKTEVEFFEQTTRKLEDEERSEKDTKQVLLTLSL